MNGPEEQKTILLVEDEALIAIMEQERLQRRGFNVIVASSGQKAIDKVRSNSAIDLILMDINLGKANMDGVEAAEAILKEYNIPILFLSNYTQREVVERTEKIGSFGFVVKDSGEAVLLASIKMAFALHETHRRLKERETAVQESEEKFRLLFEKSGDPILLLDGDRFIECNEATLKRVGCAKEQIIGLKPFDLSPERQPDGRLSSEKAHEVIDIAHREGVNRFEWVHRTFGGEEFWVEVSLTAIPIRGKRIMHTIWKDIEGRKRAEEEVRAAHQRLFDIIEFLPEATFVIDAEKKVVAWNRACEEMTGVKKEGIIGKGDYAYAIPFYGERRPLLIDQVTSGSDELDRNYKSVRRNGDRLYGEAFAPVIYNGTGAFLSALASPLFDKNGNVVGAIECLFDRTEFKRLESQLRQSQKLEAVGTLAGGIAHDFNNILTVITGFGTLLQMEMAGGTPLRPYIDQILSGAEKAAQLTQTLLAFSRQQPIALKPLNVNETISRTEKLLKRLLTEDVTVHTAFAPDDMIVMADPTQIEQMLFNLATNARDAMPKGGVLTIATKAVELDEEFTRAHGYGKPGRYALISVSDTGTGMDEATKEKIFDPFFTTKQVGKGTGLGLSSVYGTVKQHNGYIIVYSEPGMGTTLHIYLPVVESAAREEETAPPEIKRGDETILVAEDNEALRGLFRDVLIAYGYHVIEATDGADAIDQFREADKVDLLILDSVMPNKNGREAYDEISKLKPDVKVLFTSGHTRDVVLDKGIEDKRFDFVSKPIPPAALLQKVREVLDK